MRLHAFVNEPTEWSMTASRDVPDPFNTVDLDVVLTAPSGRRLVAPAFWGGGREWRVRVAADEAGEYRWRSEVRGAEGAGLVDVNIMGLAAVPEAMNTPSTMISKKPPKRTSTPGSMLKVVPFSTSRSSLTV